MKRFFVMIPYVCGGCEHADIPQVDDWTFLAENEKEAERLAYRAAEANHYSAEVGTPRVIPIEDGAIRLDDDGSDFRAEDFPMDEYDA